MFVGSSNPRSIWVWRMGDYGLLYGTSMKSLGMYKMWMEILSSSRYSWMDVYRSRRYLIFFVQIIILKNLFSSWISSKLFFLYFIRKSNKKWVFLWFFSINFYEFSASRYVMTTLDEFHIIPHGEFINPKKLSKVTIKRWLFLFLRLFCQIVVSRRYNQVYLI